MLLQAPDPDSSVSDKDNQVYLGFLKNLDSVLHKQKLQPGRDLTFYLHALRVHARLGCFPADTLLLCVTILYIS